ncbi:MAG: glycosyltransferase [Nitrospirae bacterium]|nr:glycosyltransferase [Nitrospirota bacterium]
MKLSIITAVFNSKPYIDACIRSVLNQSYHNVEHIIIDGGSTDGTLEVIKKVLSRQNSQRVKEPKVCSSLSAPCAKLTVVSEPDNGIYDALNKGIRLATGDVVGFLHADDLYAHERVIETVISEMTKHNVKSCYGDLLYVDKDTTDKVIRHWKSSPYRDSLFERGWMPPHPTFFVKKEVYEKYGCFNTDFKIAADYELMLRFLEKYRISTLYIPEVLIKMRIGGTSNRSVGNLIKKSSEDYRAMKMHNVGGLTTLLRKNLSKLPQFFKRQ